MVEALKHSGYANDAEVKINWINANDVTAENVAELLSNADGIIVPGGFGQRGTEGKIKPSAMRVKMMFQCWESAWACS